MLPLALLRSLSLFCLAALLQTAASTQTFIVPPISFTGAPAFPSAALLATTGLTPGSTGTQATIETAAQHLLDTGLFADVRFASYPKGLVFTLKPMPPEGLATAHFTNFVWWTPEELEALVRARQPLFVGSIPNAGNLQDSVIATLTTLLAEKGVAGAHVSAIHSAALGASGASTLAFSVDSPTVVIHSITLTGTSPDQKPHLATFLKSQAGEPFEEGTTRAALASGIADIYRNQGFLDAKLDTVTHAAPVVTAGRVDLDLTGTVSEGEPYKVSAFTWSGSDVVSTADFAKSAKLHAGDLAAQIALKQTLLILANAYYAKGYQDVRVQAPAKLDPATHQVAYTVRVIPGDQYRLKSIQTTGLSEAQKREFDSNWHMHPGDFYDVTYVNSFLRKNTALRTLEGYSGKYRAVADPDTHLVDLTVTFVKGGTLLE